VPSKPPDNGLASLGVLDAAEIRDAVATFLAGARRALKVSADGLCVVTAASGQRSRVHAPTEALPFASGAFSHLLCVDTLRHLGDPEEFLVETQRVLVPGGKLLVIAVEPDARATRGLMVKAGFSWSESYEAMRVEQVTDDADVIEIRVFATTGWMGEPGS
jgi:SAM-dependent methyltransferase